MGKNRWQSYPFQYELIVALTLVSSGEQFLALYPPNYCTTGELKEYGLYSARRHP